MRWPSSRLDLGAWAIGLVLLFAALGLLSGGALLLSYEPSASGAHASVERIEAGPTKWIRSAHAWSAEALVVVGLAAGTWFFLQRRPLLLDPARWIAATALLGALLLTYLSGNILPWDQQAWESWMHVAGPTGLGTEQPSEAPLGAVFAAHLLLPLAGAVAAVFVSRKVRPTLAPTLRACVRAPPFWAAPLFLAAAVVLWPPGLGPQPIPDVAASRPDWPFLWLVPLQELMGTAAVWILPGAVALIAALPWLARSWTATGRAVVVGALGAIFLVLTLLGLRG